MSDRDHNDNLDEFDIISQIFAPLSEKHQGAFNLEDDCAAYTPEPGHDLVLTKDTIVAGVHFFPDNPPASIARKALAVNISDLASKGATPEVYMMSISLPETIDRNWLIEFAVGLKSTQESYNLSLVGGDTVSTPGPLTISITMIGQVPAGRMVRRGTASPGDIIYISGTIGDSWAGLQLFFDENQNLTDKLTEEQQKFLKNRYLHPSARMELKEAVLSCASASMDISDGLGADLQKLLKASKAGADIYINKIPFSDATLSMLKDNQELMEAYINGGDDYEILATVNEEKAQEFEQKAEASKIPVTRIGRITDSQNTIKFYSETMELVELKLSGYNHFK